MKTARLVLFQNELFSTEESSPLGGQRGATEVARSPLQLARRRRLPRSVKRRRRRRRQPTPAHRDDRARRLAIVATLEASRVVATGNPSQTRRIRSGRDRSPSPPSGHPHRPTAEPSLPPRRQCNDPTRRRHAQPDDTGTAVRGRGATSNDRPSEPLPRRRAPAPAFRTSSPAPQAPTPAAVWARRKGRARGAMSAAIPTPSSRYLPGRDAGNPIMLGFGVRVFIIFAGN